jgi:mannose-6-phosphate isomerase-like protein (cupin superfamily)
MTSGFVLGPGEGSAYGFHGSVAVIKASGEDTAGQLGVIESVYPAGLSVHAGEDEMFYLLGGEMEVFCGEDRWTVGAGSFVFVPRDRPHAFTVSSAGPARALVITGPSRLAAQIAERGEPVPPGL